MTPPSGIFERYLAGLLMTNPDWIALVAVVVTLIVGVGGWIFLDPKRAGPSQSQTVRGGNGIQSGRDTRIGR